MESFGSVNVARVTCWKYYHLLSGFSSKFQLSMTILCKDVKYTKLCFNTWHFDVLKVSGIDNTCTMRH